MRLRPRRRPTRLARWARRAVGVPALVVTLLVGGTMEPALSAAGTDPLEARLAEWAREAGLGFAVTGAEKLAYQLDKPTEGGVLAGGIPTLAGRVDAVASPAVASPAVASPAVATSSTATSSTASPAAATPPPSAAAFRVQLAPIPARVSPALAGEGRWQDLLTASGQVVAQAAFLRPDAVHTGYSVGVVALDAQALRFVLHQGTQLPGPPLVAPTSLTGDERRTALATFNSGFMMKDAHGGYWQNGTSVAPLRVGAASTVFGTDGSLTIEAWPGGTPGKGVAAVRQNLALLVDKGRVNPLTHSSDKATELATWGATVGAAAYVWRSAVGTRPDGTVAFALGPALDVETLAAIMADAGCTEAMELDINSSWTSFMTYAGGVPSKLTTEQHAAADRYLTPSTRDFVAVLPR